MIGRAWLPGGLCGASQRSVSLALACWLGILATVPFGRAVVNVLRPRGWLTPSVMLACGVMALALVVQVVRWRRAGRIKASVAWVVGTLVLVVLAAAQWLPRVEERLHVVEYAALGALLWAALAGPGLARFIWAGFLGGAAGFADELVQHLLPNRVYDLWDVGLNMVSSYLGVAVVAIGAALQSRQVGAGQQPQRCPPLECTEQEVL